MDLHYVKDGQRLGPVSGAELKALVNQGTIDEDTLVWSDGMADWTPYKDAGIAANAAADDEEEFELKPKELEGEHQKGLESCAECGRSFPSTSMMPYEGGWVCSGCKDQFTQRLREGLSVGGKRRKTTPLGTRSAMKEAALSALKPFWGTAVGVTFLSGLLKLIAAMVPYLGNVLQAFIRPPFGVGESRFFLSVSREEPSTEFGMLFHGFSRFPTALGAGWLSGLVIYAPLLTMFFAAGAVAALINRMNDDIIAVMMLFAAIIWIPWYLYFTARWAFVYLLIADNPEIRAVEALRAGWRMTHGRAGEIIVFFLSFAGWFILGVIPCYLGLLFVLPYFNTTMAVYYDQILLEDGVQDPKYGTRQYI